jgi:hypothetical protein
MIVDELMVDAKGVIWHAESFENYVCISRREPPPSQWPNDPSTFIAVEIQDGEVHLYQRVPTDVVQKALELWTWRP